MYKNTKNFAYPFQTYVLLTLLQNHLLETDKKIKLMERSIFSMKNIFTNKMVADQCISSACASILDQWFEWLKNKISVDLIIYLRTSPELCFERLQKRARSEELTVSCDYLQDIHNRYEEWLLHSETPVEVSFNSFFFFS